MKKISVIIPVYNVEKYLDRCIKSVLNQTYTDFELILIDDGSTDKSGEIADSYAKSDSRVIVKHVKNGGSSSARNIGLDIASGEYITFIDSDDYVDSDYLETLEKNMTDDVDLVATQAEYSNEKGEPVYVLDPPVEMKTTYSDTRNYMGRNRHFWACMALYRRDVLGTLRFDLSYHVGEDVLFYYTYMRKTRKIKHLSKRMYHYVLYTESACHGTFNIKKFTEYYAWEHICNMNADIPKVQRICRGEYGKRMFRQLLLMRKSHTDNEEIKKKIRKCMRKNFFCYMQLKGYCIRKKTRLFYMLYMFGFDKAIDYIKSCRKNKK